MCGVCGVGSRRHHLACDRTLTVLRLGNKSSRASSIVMWVGKGACVCGGGGEGAGERGHIQPATNLDCIEST